MVLYQVINKHKTRKQVQVLASKLLGQPHSNTALDSRTNTSSISFTLKDFPVNHLPPVSAEFQATIISVVSGWVFICCAWSFTDTPCLAFLCYHRNNFMRILTHMDLPVAQPFAVAISILSPNLSLFHTIFLLLYSSVPNLRSWRRWEGRRPPLSKHPLSKKEKAAWISTVWAAAQTKQKHIPWWIPDSTRFQMSKQVNK